MDMTTTFAIVGTGWRSEFFVRLARVLPDKLRAAGIVTRTPERAEVVRDTWRVGAYLTVDDLLAHERPDYVIVSVPWPETPRLIRELVARGIKVLAETPPAPDLDGLRSLWTDVGGTGLVQVAEQYLLMPTHASRREVLRAGTIGEVTSVQVCSTHMYHAMSLARGLLDVEPRPVTVQARAFTAPLADPLISTGWTGDDTPRPTKTTIGTVEFAEDRTALYDFTDNQWWNPLRGRRLLARGTVGELENDRVVRLVDHEPVESTLVRRETGYDLNLEGRDLKHISFDGRVVYRNPYPGSGLSDDDIAVAVLAEQTGAWARGEAPEPYPLSLGCDDHALALAIETAAQTGTVIRTEREPWHR